MAQYPVIDPFTWIKSVAIAQGGVFEYDLDPIGSSGLGAHTNPCTGDGGFKWIKFCNLQDGEAFPASGSLAGATLTGDAGGSLTIGAKQCTNDESVGPDTITRDYYGLTSEPSTAYLSHDVVNEVSPSLEGRLTIYWKLGDTNDDDWFPSSTATLTTV